MKHILCPAFVVLLVVGCSQAADTLPATAMPEVKADKPEGLTFRILASRAYPQDEDIIQKGVAEPGRVVRDQKGKIIARWVPVFDSQKSGFEDQPDMVVREREKTLEVLVKYDDGTDVTGKYLTYVGRGMGQSGNPGVSLNFNAAGAEKLARLTSTNRPDPEQEQLKRRLGIIVNDSLYLAPRLTDTIRDSAIIEFNSGRTDAERRKMQQDIDDLIEVLHTRYSQTKPSIRTWLFPR